MKRTVFLFVIVLMLAACITPPPDAEPDAPVPDPTLTVTLSSEVDRDAPTPTPVPATPQGQVTLSLADFAPQPIEFQTEDGITLSGNFYPAAREDAPGVILVHMLNRSQSDWVDSGFVALVQGVAVADFDASRSYAVLTFDLRGHGESGGERDRAAYPADVAAALEAMQNRPGVNPESIAIVGASIGADSAVASCGEGCQTAVAISPGGFTGTDFTESLQQLSGKPVLCIASENDPPSPGTCRDGEDLDLTEYVTLIYENGAHGTNMFGMDLDPTLTSALLEWLNAQLG